MSSVARAHPTKHFFLEMFTRDISLEDCILDLVDNSIDALIRTRKLSPSTQLLATSPSALPKTPATIAIGLSPTKFSIHDNCGGIEPEYAKTEAFLFGHRSPGRAYLGAYGIGLKRAIFKLGNRFQMRSRHTSGGFA